MFFLKFDQANKLQDKFYELEHQILNCPNEFNYITKLEWWHHNNTKNKKFNLPQKPTYIDPLRCSRCGTRSSRKDNLKRHYKSCKTFEEHCKQYEEKIKLKKASQKHKCEKPAKITPVHEYYSKCGKYFKSRDGFKKHRCISCRMAEEIDKFNETINK